MMRLNEAAAAVRAKVVIRGECERVQVFVHMLTGSILCSRAEGPLSEFYTASPVHVMVGTYDRHVTERAIHGDILEALQDCIVRRNCPPLVVHTYGAGFGA